MARESIIPLQSGNHMYPPDALPFEHMPRPEAFGTNIGVMLVNLEGEDLSLHEPIGVEVVAAAVKQAVPGAELSVYDTQPELVRTGKIDTDRLADQIREFASDANRRVLLGFSVPIYAFHTLEALLIKLEQRPPAAQVDIVLDNAIPTYTKSELIKEKFPYVSLVRGEGEIQFAKMAQAVARGEQVTENGAHFPPNLQEYVTPLRVFTADTHNLGGSIKVEASRGCGFGACTFCSREWRSGKDYRTIPESTVVAQIRELLETFNITRFEFTDEEAFDDAEATARLISALASSDMPPVPFVASMRVDTVLALEQKGLLDQLHRVGLVKVFLGVEGGSDAYLKQIAKSQTVKDIEAAMQIVNESGIEMEIGFIMFSWRMSFDMLRENVEFLTKNHNADYVSSLFNFLAIRAGTRDEVLLRRAVKDGIKEGKIVGYNPDAHFSINDNYYQDVPFLDPRVGEVYEKAAYFAHADARLYYALKSVYRAASLPADMQDKARVLYFKLKEMRLDFMKNAVGLEQIDGIEDKRLRIVEQIQELFGTELIGDISDAVRREAAVFLKEENERRFSKGDQSGSMAVCLDNDGRVLLVRPRDDNRWAFPGGNIRVDEGREEDIDESAVREAREELGVRNLTLLDPLPTIVKEGHEDRVTGIRPRLTLYHTLARLDEPIRIQQADHEIVDTLWLPLDEVIAGRVNVRDNVVEIARYLKHNAGNSDRVEAPRVVESMASPGQ